MLNIDEIVQAVDGKLVGSTSAGSPVTSVVVDSRQAGPGALFVALRGQKHDGHDFLLDVFVRGARAALVERVPESQSSHGEAERFTLIVVPDTQEALLSLAAYWRRKLAIKVVGITGSVGKTTTKEVVSSVLGQRYRVMKNEGNFNTEIGMPLTLLKTNPSDQVLVAEMGMYAMGEIRALARLAAPNIGVVTNVGPTHLERLGSVERIAEAKSELVQELTADGVAVLNFDDDRVRAMSAKSPARTIYYGLDSRADFWASNVQTQGLKGTDFDLHHGAGRIHVRTPLLGVHSVHAALAAAAVGSTMGMSLEEVAAGLHEVSPSLRLIVAAGVNGSTVIDDSYNASPASTLAALNLLHDLKGRRVAVLGDMMELGSYAEEGHRLVGRRSADVADVLVAVGELGAIIGREALDAGKDPSTVFFASTNDQAVAQLTELLNPGDCVLVKGSRGMQMEEIVEAICRTP